MKKSCIAALGLIVAGLPMAGNTGTASAADWMSAPDIKRELVDTELAFRGRVSGKVIYREDGRMRMVSSAGRQIFGEWRIDDEAGTLCSVCLHSPQGQGVVLPHPPRWLRLSHRPGLPADAAGVLRGVPPPFLMQYLL
jgi:hypothetical protein